MNDLKDKLAANGIDDHARILEFQRAYGGVSDPLGRNAFVWGVIHQAPVHMAPNELEVLEAEGDEPALVQCADADPQDALFIDSNGAIYDSRGAPAYGSFEAMFRRGKLLANYSFDYGRWNEVKRNEAQVLANAERFGDFSDPVLRLLTWQGYVVEAIDDKIVGVFKTSV